MFFFIFHPKICYIRYSSLSSPSFEIDYQEPILIFSRGNSIDVSDCSLRAFVITVCSEESSQWTNIYLSIVYAVPIMETDPALYEGRTMSYIEAFHHFGQSYQTTSSRSFLNWRYRKTRWSHWSINFFPTRWFGFAGHQRERRSARQARTARTSHGRCGPDAELGSKQKFNVHSSANLPNLSLRKSQSHRPTRQPSSWTGISPA